MAAVAILPDQHSRRGLPAPPNLLPQPIRRLKERSPLRHRVDVGGAFQEVAHLSL